MSRVNAAPLAGLLALGMLLTGCSDSGGGSKSSGSAAAAVTTVTPTTSVPVPVASAPGNLRTGPELSFDAAAGFFGWSFPSDARRMATGGPDLTGMPNPRGEQFVDLNYRLAESDPSGFSPTGPIYFPFGGPVNALPGGPAASLFNDSPVFLVDVDPASADRLTRHPIYTSVTQNADSFRPADVLQLLPVPGRGLKVNTTYAAVVLRRLGAPGGVAHLGQSPELTELLAGRTPATPEGPALARAFAPLQAALFDMGVHPQDVAAATVFTTGDPAGRLIAQVDYVDSLLPLAPSQAPSQRDAYPTFTALTSSFSAPQYQNGFAPFLWSGGEIVTDGLGNPLAQSFKESPFQLSVPKGVMPAQGFPLYLYCHGTGGKESEAIDRGYTPAGAGAQPALGSGLASIAAPRGWGTACAAGVFSPSRIGIMAADGYLAYNFVYPVAMRDNFKQMVLELVHFRNLLKELRIDPALCPGTDASASIDGKVRFDPDRIVVGGQSLGSYLSGMLASTLDGFKGVILTGAGGSWVEFAFGPKSPFDLQRVVELLALPFGEHLDRYHPLILAFDSGVAQADNTHYLRHLVREPLPGHTPPHVLVIEGFKDQQVSTDLQRALALAIGVDFVGPDPGPTPDDQILTSLPYGGLAHVPYPLQGNRVIGGQTRTVAMVRYPEDGIREGHYVSFQLDAPKRQIGEFLDAIKAGTVPEIR